ncbi:zinc finger BED domain-containing protein RICESLEEPER 2-like [Bidens hawaiensis]|uniref:zinc finger BED domain-containing protein RICESLEEPER 2-like n=1 Tax=Bidens hawaiensis TaxID=980011 RepID=UPI00404B5940
MASQNKGKRKAAATDSFFIDPVRVEDDAGVARILPHNRNEEVWRNWDLVELLNGDVKARCKFCDTYLKHDSNSTLKKRIEKKICKALKEVPATVQAELGKDGAIFRYNVKSVHDRMARFVIQQGLPFNHFDNPQLTALIRETLQPRYTNVSRTTLQCHCLKLWECAKKDLIEFFDTLQTGVNLTSDVWSAPHGLPESYLCVTVHWIDPVSWQMMKRIIAFENFPLPHTA